MSSRPERQLREPREVADENGKKTVIRVKRGALRRFDQLTRKSESLPVEVKWDRRVSERRDSNPTPEESERRRQERRQTPPFTWDAAEFVVEGDRSKRTGTAGSDPADDE
jgi:hypothetical protein